MDEAVRARTAIVDHVSVFKDDPQEANDVQWKDMNKLVKQYRPGCFWILKRVFHHLIKGRDRRNVGPVPQSSLEQKAMDCEDKRAGPFKSFLSKLEAAHGPADATVQGEVDKRAALECGIREKEAQLYLSGKGFIRIRRKKGSANEYFYQYRFEDARGEKGAPQYVKAAPASESSA